jgi:hypothetical protein
MHRFERASSPAQIRARAATAFRNRALGLPKLPPLRQAAADETPLSLDEMRLAFALGIASPQRELIQQ